MSSRRLQPPSPRGGAKLQHCGQLPAPGSRLCLGPNSGARADPAATAGAPLPPATDLLGRERAREQSGRKKPFSILFPHSPNLALTQEVHLNLGAPGTSLLSTWYGVRVGGQGSPWRVQIWFGIRCTVTAGGPSHFPKQHLAFH